MKILITGANGFLGQHLSLYFSQTKHQVFATGRGENRNSKISSLLYFSADLTDPENVNEVVQKAEPDIVIHTAAMSRPDECHTYRNECLLQNVVATKHLLNAFKTVAGNNSMFIYMSTDFVFGEDGPHKEDDKKQPLNFYGESKLQAEALVEETGVPYAIIRPVFIYGPVWEGIRPSFIQWVLNNLRQHKSIKVVSDQQRTPTFVFDICKGIQTIIDQHITGVFHLAGKDIISPYDMAVITAKVAGLETDLVENVTSETFPEPVTRAKRSGLQIEKAKELLNYNPVSFEEGVTLSLQPT